MSTPADHPGPLPPAEPERAFPGEHEWLDLPLPLPADLDLRPAAAFAADVVRAVHADAAGLPPSQLAAWTTPEPSPGFVARTTAAIRQDRVARWQHLLARHLAPEPSPQFVARTLAALAAERGARPLRPVEPRRSRWFWPLLGAAAAALLWLLLDRDVPPPFERRLAGTASPAFAHAYAPTPLAVLLTQHDRRVEPEALDDVGADGVWLLLAEGR